MLKVFEEVEKKNKTLASWTKERVEQVGHMAVVWDNFQLMLDNHHSVISKQVIQNSPEKERELRL